MKVRTAPWIALSYDLMRLGIEAQAVMALRLMRLAAGGALAEREAARMVTEKAATVVNAQTAAAVALATGARGAAVSKKAVRVYRRRVRANRRRLTRHK
jgi:hypothetical protein